MKSSPTLPISHRRRRGTPARTAPDRRAHLETRRDGAVATITLNRAKKLNALTAAMVTGLRDAIRTAGADPRVRVIILRGAGKHFTVGADIRVMQESSLEGFRPFILAIQEVTRTIQEAGKPVIAALRGYAVGGGSELATVCDLRVAAAGARLGFPEVKIGITVTSGVAYLLGRLIGNGRAKRLTLTGELIEAEEAERIGLVDWVVPDDRLEEETEALARRIARCGPLAIRLTKRLFDRAGEAGLEATLQMETEAVLDAFVSADRHEGMRAFLEKRTPRFTGR